MTKSWIAERIARWKPAAELVVLLVAAPVFLFMRPVLTPALALLPILARSWRALGTATSRLEALDRQPATSAPAREGGGVKES